MAAKPTETFNFEPSGSAVITIPTAKQAAGFLPGEGPPAQYANWLWRTTSRLYNYVKDGIFDGDVTIDSLISKVVRINAYAFQRAAGTLAIPHTCFAGGTLQATYVDAFTEVVAWLAIRPGHKITSLEFDYRCADAGDGLSFEAYAFSHAAPTGAVIALDDAGTSSGGVDATRIVTVGGGGWTAPSYPTLVRLRVTCTSPGTEFPRLYRARVVTAVA